MKLISHVSMMYWICYFFMILSMLTLLLSIYLLVTDGDGVLVVDRALVVGVVVFIVTVHVVVAITGQENA